MQNDAIVITGIARTPQGKLLGVLKDLSATQLGAYAIHAAVSRSGLPPSSVQEIMMGCVLPAGLGQAPARQAAIQAGLSMHTTCSTINKVCGSGMKAIMLAHDQLQLLHNDVMVAGGMESMSNAPYLALKARGGYRLGTGEFVDHMMRDGLEDAYDKGQPMGYFAEGCASQFHFTREQQDHFARSSLLRAQKAIQEKKFEHEITGIPIVTKTSEYRLETDEHPNSVDIAKISALKPVFLKDGTITAANSSAIADGAAACVLMRSSTAEKLKITPLARIVGFSSFATTPDQFTTAPVDAIEALLKKINWTLDDVDLFEINEAFAVVPLFAMQKLGIPHEKLNVHGGGCALGHPIGATGARIVVTLIAALQHYGLKRGIAALCIGGGEATAMAIEMM